jgi:hypothetical protein
MFSIVVVLAYIPTSSVCEGFLLPAFVVGGDLDDSHSNRGEVFFALPFLPGMVRIFSFSFFFLVIWISSLEKVLFSSIDFGGV